MGSDARQTRCPYCYVAFYVSNAQILAAEGTVRCGICLSLFDAQEHVIAPDGESTTVAQTPELTAESGQTPESFEAEGSPLEEIRDEAPAFDCATESVAREGGQNDVARLDSESVAETAEASESGEESEESEASQRPLYLRQLNSLSDALPEQVPGLLVPEPVKPGHSSARQWTLLFLAIVGALALFMQLLFYTSAQLSLNERYRPALVTLCTRLNCPIAEQRDLALIHSEALVIQKHPVVADALQVDVVIINRAGFDQAFPGLQLQFKDLRGSVVAQRTFRPDQYLSGALTDLTSMISQQTYQIRLELVVPDVPALSYALNIVN